MNKNPNSPLYPRDPGSHLRGNLLLHQYPRTKMELYLNSLGMKIIDKIQIEQRFSGMMDQFHSEIDALKNLSHPNIIQLYDVYTTKSKIYIVMELMNGGELFDYVVTKGTLTEAEASVIVRMVTGALVYMHECNIIHRDLKPVNIFLDSSDQGVVHQILSPIPNLRISLTNTY